MNKNKLILFSLFVVVSLLSFLYGVISTARWLEPLPTIKNVIQYFNKFKNYKYKKDKIDNSLFYNENIDDEINTINQIFKSLDVDKTRKSIISNYILPNSVVEIEFNKEKSISCHENSTIIETNFYGIKQRGVFEKNSGKNLIIYFQGHGGDPCNFGYYNQIKENFHNSNYDFLSFSMFGIGTNSFESISFPLKLPQHNKSYNYENFDTVSMGKLTHGVIQFFFDENHPNNKPLSLFLSSPYYIINEVIKRNDYEKIFIMGISGGGFYSTVLAGLIPEINHLFSFSGHLPFLYRIETDSYGHFEHRYSHIWKEYDYYTFYFLSLFDINSELNRNSYHIYSEFDKCCFSKPEIDYFKKSIDTLKIPNLQVKIFENEFEHTIYVDWLTDQINLFSSQP